MEVQQGRDSREIIQGIDTNILVKAYDVNEQYHEEASQLLKDCFEKKTSYVLSLQNLTEFYSVMTTKKKISPDKIDIVIRQIINWKNFDIHEPTVQDFMTATRMNERFEIPFWDAMIAATLTASGCINILTEDSDFQKVPWINAVNPFED